MSLIDNIATPTPEEAYEILKSAGTEELFQKAHQDGDIHPNGKWVWVSSAAGGKGDWRVKGGRVHKKQTSYSASSSSSSTTSNTTDKPTKIRITTTTNSQSKPTPSSVQTTDKTNNSSNQKKPSQVKSPSNVGKSKLTDLERDKIKKYSLSYVSDRLKELEGGGKSDAKIEQLETIIKKLSTYGVGDRKVDNWGKYHSQSEIDDDMNKYKDELATTKDELTELKKRKKELLKRKREFIENTNDTLTDDEVHEWIDELETRIEPVAVVNNTWHTFSGRIGSTSASIRIGNGKAKSLSEHPDWRPIAYYSYYTQGWNERIKIKGTCQSWDEIKTALSDVDIHSIKIYKHPHQ